MNLQNPSKIILTLSACLLIAGAGSAPAASLLLDFGQTNAASPYLTLDPGHAVETISGSDQTWNTIKTSSATSSLLYGDGSAASGITLSLGQEATAGNNTINYSTAIANLNLAGTGGGTAGQQNMLGAGSIYGDNTASTAVGRDAIFGGGTSGAGDAIGLRLDGLAAGDYLVYVMSRNVNSDAASLPMNIYSAVGISAGTFDFSSLAANAEANTGYASATYAGQYTTFQAGQNYVGLNVTIGSGDSLFLAVDGGSATDTRGFLNMVEITPAPAPEPGTLALLGVGFSALLVARKKRRTA